MRFAYSEACLDHDTGQRHPESPDRLLAIREGLKKKHGVEYVEPDPVTAEAVAAVHDDDYVEKFREFCADGGGNWDPDTVCVEATWDAAMQSAGMAQWAAEAALEGADGRNTTFSVGRPPGHHAVEDDAMGFCFVNNAAVAAQAVIDSGHADRVAIFDWDVHHGNGTQDILYDREDVFFASVHEDGIYPGTGGSRETGNGDGEGTTLNAPLPAGSGDPEYVAVVDELIAPAVDRFDADLLIVSAGFDAHRNDPISRMQVSTEGYALLADRVRAMADRVGSALSFVLEGGYSLDVLAESIGIVHETFDGRDPIDPDEDVDEDVADLIAEYRGVHDLD